MSDTQGDNLESVLAAGAATGTPAEVSPDESYAVLPESYRLKDLERFKEVPDRTRGQARINRLQSLIDYILGFKDNGSVVYADQDEDNIVAVLDHPTVDQPRWGDHKAAYTCPRSKEWNIWTLRDGQTAGQEDTARFLEDHGEDIYVPESDPGAYSAADMLEVATTLNAQRDVSFNSSTRLSDGSGQLAYTETVNDTAGKNGSMIIPEHFYIAIPVFEGGDKYVLKVKLRYRVRDGGLKLWFDLHRPQDAHDQAFREMVEKVQSETECPMYWGTI